MGSEFAEVVQKIFDEYEELLEDDINEEISELELEVQSLEDYCSNYDDIMESLDYLNGELDKLEKYIDENADGTDYMRGMQDAYDMIER